MFYGTLERLSHMITSALSDTPPIDINDFSGALYRIAQNSSADRLYCLRQIESITFLINTMATHSF